MKRKRVFGELELAILQICKDGTSLTIRDVVTGLGQGDCYTTVMTVMNRLVEKGQLTRQLSGNQYEYTINQERSAQFLGFLCKLKNKVFGGKSASMISFLIDEDEGITDVELAHLEEIIKRKREAKKLMTELGWIYAFNVIINAFFSFITVALLMQLLVMVFQVKQPRLRALILSIPLFKLVLDLYLYDFSQWALAHQINPCWVLPGSRTFLFAFGWVPAIRFIPFTIIQLMLSDGKTFTLADLIALPIGHFWVTAIVLAVGSISLVFFARWLLELYRSSRSLTNIVSHSLVCRRPIRNQLLKNTLIASKIKLMVSPSLKVPCCFGIFTKYILIPRALANRITQAEFETIIAHEASHLTWYDAVLRLAFQALAAVFWWIPIKRWIRSIEVTQELACDSSINKFALSRVDLACALVKVARCAKYTYQALPVASFFQVERIRHRIDSLLQEESRKVSLFWKVLHVFSIGSIVMVVLFGKFWIF